MQTESEGIEKDIPSIWKQKESLVAIFISGETDIKTKTATKGKDHYI